MGGLPHLKENCENAHQDKLTKLLSFVMLANFISHSSIKQLIRKFFLVSFVFC